MKTEKKLSPDGESRQDSDADEGAPHAGNGAASAFERMKQWVRQRAEFAEARAREPADGNGD